MDTLQQALHTARSFRPLTREQMSALLARTADAAEAKRFEAYKTTTEHDSTTQHPEWLG
jgi:hypothetical protein